MRWVDPVRLKGREWVVEGGFVRGLRAWAGIDREPLATFLDFLEYVANGVHLVRPITLSPKFIQFLEMRREMIHIVRYLLLCKDELGVVGDIVARRSPRAPPSLRLWDTFQMLSRRRHRQALCRGKGPKDVSFLI